MYLFLLKFFSSFIPTIGEPMFPAHQHTLTFDQNIFISSCNMYLNYRVLEFTAFKIDHLPYIFRTNTSFSK